MLLMILTGVYSYFYTILETSENKLIKCASSKALPSLLDSVLRTPEESSSCQFVKPALHLAAIIIFSILTHLTLDRLESQIRPQLREIHREGNIFDFYYFATMKDFRAFSFNLLMMVRLALYFIIMPAGVAVALVRSSDKGLDLNHALGAYIHVATINIGITSIIHVSGYFFRKCTFKTSKFCASKFKK